MHRTSSDDSPENTVGHIKHILKEEAQLLGASFKCQEERKNLSNILEITIELQGNRFNIYVLWVHSSELSLTTATIGSGFISPARWDLELLHGNPHANVMGLQLGWNPAEACPGPPFCWGLYPAGSDYIARRPAHILDGTLLRRLLRDALVSSPSRSA